VGTIENADPAASGEADCRASEKIIIQLFPGRRLEGMNITALRIDTIHHVFDDAIFARGIHTLQHYEQRPLAMSVKTILELGETLGIPREHRAGSFLVESEAAGIGWIERREPESFGIIDAEPLDQARRIVCHQWCSGGAE
jgi:hypothetical protein